MFTTEYLPIKNKSCSLTIKSMKEKDVLSVWNRCHGWSKNLTESQDRFFVAFKSEGINRKAWITCIVMQIRKLFLHTYHILIIYIYIYIYSIYIYIYIIYIYIYACINLCLICCDAMKHTVDTNTHTHTQTHIYIYIYNIYIYIY